ncbi:hypothetical protein EON66_10610, partial [archaeon]
MMEGYEELASGVTNFDYGITPRLMRDIFAALNADVGADGRLLAFNVKVASLEIYNEQMYDLLSDAGSKAAQNVIIRENDAGDQVLTGIVEVPVSSAADMAKWLAKGMQARAVASTNMNARSSRSHAVFTITIEQTLSSSSAFEAGAEAAPAANNDAQLVRRVSRIHIVDLAGSERAKKTGADGARLREASSINRGLLALGNVINALAAAEDSAAAASTEASSS